MYPYLHFVEFRNFKVFKRTDFGPFQPHTLYAVVGRNGVGKSCFLDGLTFVFGERNLEKLRVSSARRFRHYETPYSSPSQSSQEDCSVAAVFCLNNEQRKRFERKIDSDCSDVFMINNEVVTFNEYQMELSDLHINVKFPHFQITSETLATVAVKTPEQITELFEEVSGSSVFREQYNTLKKDEKVILQNISLAEEEKSSAIKCFKQTSKYFDDLSKIESIKMQADEASKEWALFMLYHFKHIKEGCENEVFLGEESLDALKFDIDIQQLGLSKKKEDFNHLSNLKSDLEAQLKELQFNRERITLSKLQAEVEYFFKKLRLDKDSCDEACSKLIKSEETKKIAQENLSNIQLAQGFLDSDCTCLVDRNCGQYKAYLELKKHFARLVWKTSANLQPLKLAQVYDSSIIKELQFKRKSLLDKLKASLSRESELREEYERISDDWQMRRQEDAVMTSKERTLNLEISSIEEQLASITRRLEDAERDDDNFEEKNERISNLSCLQNAFFSRGIIIYRLNSEDLRTAEISCEFDDTAPGAKYNEVMKEVLDDYENCVLVRTTASAEECRDFIRTLSEKSETFIPMTECEAEMASPQKDAGVGSLMSEHVPLEGGFLKETVRYLAQNIVVCQSEKEARGALKKGFYVITPRDVQPQHFEKTVLEKGESAELKNCQERLTKELAQLRNDLAGIKKTDNSHLLKLERISRELENQVKSATQLVMETKEDIHKVEERIRQLEEAMSRRMEEITPMESELASKEDDFFKDFCASVGVTHIQEYDQLCKYCKEDKIKKLQLASEEELLTSKLVLLIETTEEARIDLTYWEYQVRKCEEKVKDAQEDMDDMSKSMEGTQQKILELTEQISANSSEQKVLKTAIVSLENQTRRAKAECKDLRERVEKSKLLLWNLETEARKAYIYLSVGNATGGTSPDEATLPEASSQDEASPPETSSPDEATLPEASSPDEATLPEAFSQDEASPTEGSSQDEASTVARSSDETHPPENSSQESSQKQNSQAMDVDSAREQDHLLVDCDASFIDFDELDEGLKSITDVDLIIEHSRKLADRKLSLQEDVEGCGKMEEKTHMTYQEAEKAVLNAKKALKSWRIKLKGNHEAFKLVKKERQRFFTDCYDSVRGSVTTLFKAVAECDEAEVYLTTINPSEPYLDGIAMHCWVPYRRSNMAREFLSGGEKSMLSFALLLSFDAYRRTSIFVADEVDSQTDPFNTERFAVAWKAKAEASQVFAVSHKMAFQSRADVLISILKNGSVIYLDQRDGDFEDMETE